MISRSWIVAIALLMLAGCAVGPKYKRPPVVVPDIYRGLAPEAGTETASSLGDEKWWTVFQDPQLQQLIREALSQNYDVRIAAARVLQAQAVLGITRADQFPTIAAGASTSNQRFPATRITTRFRDQPDSSEPFVSVGTRLLGQVPPGHRGGTCQCAGHGMGSEGSDIEPGQQRGNRLFPIARTGC